MAVRSFTYICVCLCLCKALSLLHFVWMLLLTQCTHMSLVFKIFLMLSRALVVFQSANRWHCESHGFSCLFYLLFFLCVCVCVSLPTLFFLFSVSVPFHLSYHSLLHISMRNEVAEGDVCFTKYSEDVLSGRGVKSLPKRPDLLRLGAGLGLPWPWLR